MPEIEDLYLFKCSVSEDLYGASPNSDGSPLPTPGGGTWILIDGIQALGLARSGFDEKVARRDIEHWGCHWFTSEGPTDIYWGENGPPVEK